MTDILGLVGRLKKTADAARRTDGSDSPLSAEIRSAAAALEAMHGALVEQKQWLLYRIAGTAKGGSTQSAVDKIDAVLSLTKEAGNGK